MEEETIEEQIEEKEVKQKPRTKADAYEELNKRIWG